jgi:predicted enzyme related to lactoylglutathione lyase
MHGAAIGHARRRGRVGQESRSGHRRAPICWVSTITGGSTMKLKVTSIYVDDQANALRFYTDVVGLAKKTDVTNGPYRWLTVASPEEPDGVELQLAPNDNPAAKAYQQAMFEQGQPAAMFYVDDVQQEYDRMKASGAEFTTPPTKVTGSTIAVADDTVGNLIQIVALDRWQ